MRSEKNDTADRELRFSRVLDAPIEMVWEVWTKPEHITLWWGPDGFKNTIHKMEIKQKGDWHLIMHSPTGIDYEIKSVFREVIKHKKIVYEQLNQFKYIATIEFEKQNHKTLINWIMIFESKEYLIEAAKTYGVVDGFKQNAEKLVDYLSQLKQYKNEND